MPSGQVIRQDPKAGKHCKRRHKSDDLRQPGNRVSESCRM
ncbi:MAG: hypothetical protein ACLUD0_09810 [Eubacterium ramulus]